MTEEPDAADDRARWDARWAASSSDPERAPSEWAVGHCLALPDGALILDVAGGAGRHAIPVARGSHVIVVVVDFVFGAVRAAVRQHPGILGTVANASALPFRDGSVDGVLCVNFLDRAIFPSLVRALRPGGTLVYETFTRHHRDLVAAGRAHGPSRDAFLLADGELRHLVAPLAIREYAEGLVVDSAGERHVARVVAVRT